MPEAGPTDHLRPESEPSQPTMRRVRGALDHILFSNPESGYLIGRFLPDEAGARPFTILGNLPEVQIGESLELDGQWTRHPDHGKQFRVHSFRVALPSTLEGMRKLLGSGLIKGIGPQTAERIVAHFGTDTLRVLGEESGRLREVPKIGPKKAREIKQAWEAQRLHREALLYLRSFGVGTALSNRIIRKFGPDTADILREDPYRLAREIRGIGFQTADRMAGEAGLAPDSPTRLQAGLEHVLDRGEQEGHTGLRRETLVETTAETLQIDPAQVESALDESLRSKRIVEEQLAEGSLLQRNFLAQAERFLARRLNELRQCPSALPPIQIDAAVQWAQDKAGFAFAPEQAEAIRQAIRQTVSIITGGPGTGKTTLLRALTAIVKAKKGRVALASPTGRAAQRLSESARAQAYTIHRLLRFDPAEGRFTRDEEHPLRADMIIVDEASMIDIPLGHALLRAVRPGTHLVFVGDAFQLPSVGPGAFLRDLIESGRLPVCHLQRVFRRDADNRINGFAYQVLGGHLQLPPEQTLETLDLKLDDLFFLRATDPENAQRLIVSLFERIAFPALGLDPVRDVQVLAPIHRGEAGVQTLNRHLQQKLNPTATPQPEERPRVFFPGDKVIQTRNDYDRGVFNGDLGRIQGIGSGGIEVAFEERTTLYSPEELIDLQLAYALSVHKSQGSEYPVVIFPLLKQHFIMLDRQLVYTAVTRARSKLILVGDPEALRLALRKQGGSRRQTTLAARLARPTG